ncbi:MAG: hypothetical protein ACOX1P_13635 [Thermoguttaceae bacterium]|jgi:hypothetical protein
MRARRRILFSLLPIVSIFAATYADAATLYVGAASCNITPESPSFLFGQFSARVSRGVEYPVTANILALQSREGDRSLDSAIIISVDTGIVWASFLLPVREGIQKELPQFDLYTDFAVRMKARSKAVQTFVVQLANGAAAPQPPADAPEDRKTHWHYSSSGTYLPSERAVKGGGYGAVVQSNVVGPEGGQLLVEETLKMINAMF